MAALRDELTSTRAKLKAIEEGQMKVDNKQLSGQLDNDRDDLNRERAAFLKAYAAKNDKFDEDKKKLIDQVKQREAAAAKKNADAEEEINRMEDYRIKLDDNLKAQSDHQEELNAKDQFLTKKAKDLNSEQQEIKQEKLDLAEYAADLDSMRDNLLRERANILHDKARLTMEKE